MVKRIVFNSKRWRAAGGDIGDNSCFFEEAEILEEYYTNSGRVADVCWPDGSVTHGHFVSGMEEIQ